MLTVYNCVVNEHDLRVLALAVLVCALSAFTAINLLHHVERSTGQMRFFWLAVSATSIGFGIWATHYIAMLAFSPGIQSGYDVDLTAVSLVVAILLTGVGMATATWRRHRGNHMIGGAVIGAGISAMHYTGMAAYDVEGRIVWDYGLVAASVIAGIAIGTIAIPVGLRNATLRMKAAGAALLTLAICAMHFTAMAAVSIYPDSSIIIPESAVEPFWLALVLTVASCLILFLAATALWIDIRDYRRSRQEAGRMRELANAAVEGLLVCDGPRIVAANESLVTLSGRPGEDLIGEHLSAVFPHAGIRDLLLRASNELIESDLRPLEGEMIPVELVARRISYGGRPHTAIAVRDLRERKMAEADIRRLADHDMLTGLPNRRSFSARLDAEIQAVSRQQGRCLALLCLDLDRFKEINDLYGHAAGDAALCKVAHCVSRTLRDGQMLARLGGDEFAIIAPGLTDPIAAGRIAENILDVLAKAEETADFKGLTSTSIGIAICPNDAIDREMLLSHADKALYRAKAEGRNTYRYFEAAMGAEAVDRRLMEHDLRHAAARGELRLVYQPQKHIDSGETIGFEALLRWDHPVRGSVAPAVFVPLAEESGAIVQIGEWVLETACREAARWREPLMIAVNVSAVQLLTQQFARTVHSILLTTGLAPSRLEIEITESAMIRDMHRALATLRQVKALGVRVAMDDFGTGYSSLSNLRAFPFDKIKIDGSFIKAVERNDQAAAIVRAVLGLGRGLGLPVLAEGVETSEELKFLSQELCPIGQGYYLGRPGPIETFSALTGVSDEPRTPEPAAPRASAG